MVDEGRVTRLLARIHEDLLVLTEDAAHPEVVAADRLRLDAVKYRFVTAIEGCTRVAHHLAASEGWTAPDSDAAALRCLGEQGVLSASTAEAVARAAGCRNVLVHQYAEVDDSAVIENLGRVDDLRAFVREVAAWLDRPSN